jgi:hypothetical protein
MNWETIIRHYNSHHRSNKQKEFQWFRRQPSLEAAISVAAKAEAEPKAGKERGLRYSHQHRITRKALQQADRLLLESHDELQQCKCFHELWLLLKNILEAVDGLGELYIYDTSLRIGAYLNLHPDRVYLHAGTSKGAKAFGIVSRHKEWIDLGELPNILRELPADEIEDILCIYKDKAVSSKGSA